MLTEEVPRRTFWPLEVYRSAIGKKWVMAVTGIVLMGWVLLHMLGNLHLFEGPAQLNEYSEALREMGEPLVPRSLILWVIRLILIGAFALHIHASYALTVVNWRARAQGDQGPKDYEAADYASRSMRWSGVLVLLFIIYHLMDLSWGIANPGFVRGAVYRNIVASLSQAPVALAYVLGSVLLGVHLYHGAWSMFQSLGWNHPRFNHWRRWFAVGFAALITIGFVSSPILVLAGVVE